MSVEMEREREPAMELSLFLYPFSLNSFLFASLSPCSPFQFRISDPVRQVREDHTDRWVP